MSDQIARLRYRVRSFCARRPKLFRFLYRHSPRHRGYLVRPETELVIEGFPRSGNTYAVWAFLHANPGARVAHHLHAQAQIMNAVALGLPVIVLLREPAEAVRSMLVRHPHVGAALALRTYMAFYSDIAHLRSRYLLVPFAQLTGSFGQVIGRVNEKFGKAFKPFVDSEENRQQVFARIDQANVAGYGGLRVSHLPRPHRDREALKAAVSFAGCEAQLAQASAIYEQLLKGSDQ